MGDSSFKTRNIQDRSGPPFCVRKQICSTTNMAKSNWHRRQLERGTSCQTWDNLQIKKNDYNWIEDIQHIRIMNWLGCTEYFGITVIVIAILLLFFIIMGLLSMVHL